MTAPPPGGGEGAPRADVAIARARPCTVELYRSLYDAVGRPWHWVDRKRLSDDELARILGDPAVEVHVLRVGGEPAGYAELDRRVAGEIELAYFGLMPAFVGQGLGGYFLRWAVARAWSYAPRRVWVHTCTLDHPSALPCYLRAGFREYARAVHGAHVDDGQP